MGGIFGFDPFGWVTDLLGGHNEFQAQKPTIMQPSNLDAYINNAMNTLSGPGGALAQNQALSQGMANMAKAGGNFDPYAANSTLGTLLSGLGNFGAAGTIDYAHPTHRQVPMATAYDPWAPPPEVQNLQGIMSNVHQAMKPQFSVPTPQSQFGGMPYLPGTGDPNGPNRWGNLQSVIDAVGKQQAQPAAAPANPMNPAGEPPAAMTEGATGGGGGSGGGQAHQELARGGKVPPMAFFRARKLADGGPVDGSTAPQPAGTGGFNVQAAPAQQTGAPTPGNTQQNWDYSQQQGLNQYQTAQQMGASPQYLAGLQQYQQQQQAPTGVDASLGAQGQISGNLANQGQALMGAGANSMQSAANVGGMLAGNAGPNYGQANQLLGQGTGMAQGLYGTGNSLMNQGTGLVGQGVGMGQNALGQGNQAITGLLGNNGPDYSNANQTLSTLGGLANTFMQQGQGQGPNPALDQLNLTSNDLIRQNAAMVGSSKGMNPALAGRLSGYTGAQQLQEAAGQGALMRAQQTLASQQAAANTLSGMSNLQAGMAQQGNAQRLAALQGAGGLGAQFGGLGAQFAGIGSNLAGLGVNAQGQGAGLMNQAAGLSSNMAQAANAQQIAAQQAAGGIFGQNAGLGVNGGLQGQMGGLGGYGQMTSQQAQMAQAAQQAQLQAMTAQGQLGLGAAGLQAQIAQMQAQNPLAWAQLAQQGMLGGIGGANNALGNYFGALGGLNNANVAATANQNNVNAPISAQNTQNTFGVGGGVMQGGASALGLPLGAAKGGEVPHLASGGGIGGLNGANLAATGNRNLVNALIASQNTQNKFGTAGGFLNGLGAGGALAALLGKGLKGLFGPGGDPNAVPNSPLESSAAAGPWPGASPLVSRGPWQQEASIPNGEDPGQMGEPDWSLRGQNSGPGGESYDEASWLTPQQPTPDLMVNWGGAAHGGPIDYAMAGGGVPGKARYHGDDERNDIVPAKLSPGEIVLPRTVTEAPDAEQRAAAFVAAIKAKKSGAKGYAKVVEAQRGR